ncbi:hypothetical protein Cgig2_020241 [Carnegiea gigantea]|uniref:DUF4283 domain-containing protein n=1 Tax=Carnegiea gigantea TaxID=171969 RepID=A0A9Q1KVS0_9CARY|nr:hypothetical protein Cgig2_020241 [Carnegiea gigantea]
MTSLQTDDHELSEEPMEQELSPTGNVVMSEQRLEEPEISMPRVSTYAAKVDPNEGGVLVHSCSMWSDGSKPSTGGYGRIYKVNMRDLSITKIALVRKGLFLVRFEKEQDKLQVTQWGIYFFDSKPFVVKPWNENMEMNLEVMHSIPLWVQFPELDIRYWGTNSLSKLGSLIGIPVKTDKYTKNKDYLHYARMLIEVPMEGPFPDTINFVNDSGVLVKQRITFEWKPVKCNQCQQIRHKGKDCRNKQAPSKEWRVVNRPRPAPSEATQCGVEHPQSPVPVHTSQNEKQDGFIEVLSKAAVRRSTTSRVEMCLVTSPFAVLMGYESLSEDIRGDPGGSSTHV